MTQEDLLVRVLRSPTTLAELSPAEWSLLLRQARHADLIGRLAMIADAHPAQTLIPQGPRRQLEAARILTRAQHEDVLRELAHLARALAPLGIQPVLLKGAAYLLSDGPAALGRTFSDIDILVPFARLPEVEAHLMMGGWVTTHLEPYDQRYYRDWMHELPPMEHLGRHAVLDVHHAILPRTARLQPDTSLLLERAVEISPEWRVLAPVDMVLHCITHLLHNEEFSHGLRDLSDLDLMLRRFAQRDGFWADLLRRSQQLDLARPLHYGLRLVREILRSPVPDEVQVIAASAAPAAPLDAAMHRMWRAALRPSHPSSDTMGARWARMGMYCRAHWLRMPPALLARHAIIKGWRSRPWRRQPQPD